MAKIQTVPLRSKSKVEGYRVLVLPQWPKGLKRSAVDCWAKDMAPAPDLLKHRSCGLSAAAFDYVYRNWLSRPCMQNSLKPLALLSLRRRITILCGCPDSSFCHDRVIAEALEKCRQGMDFAMRLTDCMERA